MRCSTLDPSTRSGNEPFNGGSVEPSSKLFFFRLNSRDYGDSEEFFVHATVEVEDIEDFGVGGSFGKMCSVTLLPKEFTRSKEGFFNWRRPE